MTQYEEDKILASALDSIGLRFWREPRYWNVKATDKSGELEFDGYSENSDWIDVGALNVEILGEIKTFVRIDSIVFSSKERSERIIDNPFFGIRSFEELSMQLDLLDCKKDVKPWIR